MKKGDEFKKKEESLSKKDYGLSSFPKGKKRGQSEGEPKKEAQEEISQNQIDRQNNILKGFIWILIIVFVAFIIGVIGGLPLASWLGLSQNSSFEYQGVHFDIVNEIAPYRTNLAIYKNSITGAFVMDSEQPVYFYIRNDPRKLDEIEFNGRIFVLENMVMNSTGDLKCEGKGIIGTANLAQLYRTLGVNVVRDEKAVCDEEGRFMFVQLEEGNETRIDQTGSACYTLTIKDCEILEVTEKFMIETFIELQKIKEKTKGVRTSF